jgi:hypothetical protein
MKCETVQQNIVLVTYGELPDEDLASLEHHLAECEACNRELKDLLAMHEGMAAGGPVPELSPNLVARARMKLDEELDSIPPHGLFTRLQSNLWSWLGHVQSAPALMCLLVGVGFLAGNFTRLYQVAHRSAPTPPIVIVKAGESTIANVTGIVQTPNSEQVQVSYNRIVPETLQGTLDDPQVRELLMVGVQAAANPNVREKTVSLMTHECQVHHACVTGPGGSGIRDALLVTLHTDRSPAVRLKAMEGLEPYVADDERVRDAVLDALMHDSSESVRTHAIGLLTPVESDSSVRQVMRTVSTTDQNPYIRDVSTRALAGTEDIQ